MTRPILPRPRACWPLRLPLVRHGRWLVCALRFDRWWQTVGRFYWLCPNEADLRYLRDVWRGTV